MITADKRLFGMTPDGKDVFCFTLTNTNGMRVEILNYGCAVRACFVPDRRGGLTDVVLGFDDLGGYISQDKYIGCIAGRVCNRIGGGIFLLNGRRYCLFCNNGKNHLHGGREGFDKKVFDASLSDGKLILTYISPDGEEGYPALLAVTVVYTLSDDNTLRVEYHALSDKDTLFSPTNHSYFNLSGHSSGSILGQKIKINAHCYTPTNRQSVPDGTLVPVDGTPLDLRSFTEIGEHIDDPFDQLLLAGGYDCNFALLGNNGAFKEAAAAVSEDTGIQLTVSTDLPGMQFYTGNFLSGVSIGKNGTVYQNRDGFCLETQYFPNAINCPSFTAPVIKAGKKMVTATEFNFTIKE